MSSGQSSQHGSWQKHGRVHSTWIVLSNRQLIRHVIGRNLAGSMSTWMQIRSTVRFTSRKPENIEKGFLWKIPSFQLEVQKILFENKTELFYREKYEI